MNQSHIVNEPVIVALTGASGAAYGLRLIQRLAQAGMNLHILLSDAARVVLKQEADLALPDTAADSGILAGALADHLHICAENIRCYALDDWFSPTASGSAGIR